MRWIVVVGLIMSIMLIAACAKQASTTASTPAGSAGDGSGAGTGTTPGTMAGGEGATPATGAPAADCVDTDGGKNYNLKGTVTPADSGAVKEDRCTGTPTVSPNQLKEYFCNPDGSRGEEYYDCPNGCNDGACA